MGKIEKALNTFFLSKDFTDDELEKAYGDRKKTTELDYDYQILKIYEYLRDILKDIDIKRKKIINIPKEIEKFYEKETTKLAISQLIFSINNFTDILDIYIENSKTKEDLERNFNEFKKQIDESYMMFINLVFQEKYEKEDIEFAQKIIFSKVKTIKELMIETYNLATNNKLFITEKFKIMLEETSNHNSDEYRKGINHYMQIKLAKTYEEAQTIYDIAVSELFNSNTKSNLR